VLAEDSESADVTAELVDVGGGTKESDYAGKNVKGKIVLVSAQPGAVQNLAVGTFGAVGIVSYAPNQKTAWSGDDQDPVRWGHLETFSEHKTFAFMVSLKRARAMQEWLASGKNHVIRLHAVVKAGQHPGNYEVVAATIPGGDPKLKQEVIAFSCHLDHQRPGANDNASGCATILEVARTLQKLIEEGKLARPARTMQFVFPPEIEGTLALLTGKFSAFEPIKAKQEGQGISVTASAPIPAADSPLLLPGPEWAKRIKAVIHMDMVGGGPETKAVFHVTRGPMSLPSFVHGVAWAFAEWVNAESYAFAATGKAVYPLVEPEGGKEPLRAEYSDYSMGSDHDVYQDSSFGIPAIYLNDWPDRYIHTNFDAVANIDPTKLKRVGFIGAASGYFLAQLTEDNKSLSAGLESGERLRQAQFLARARSLLPEDACSMVLHNFSLGDAASASRSAFLGKVYPPQTAVPSDCSNLASGLAKAQSIPKTPGAKLVWRRKPSIRGPLAVFGYDYFADHAKAVGMATPGLLSYEGLWGAGEQYAYEVLNFADGERNAEEVRDRVSAEYGPIPLELVVEYLKALGKIGVLEQVEESGASGRF
jgi:hypothetical protein